MSKVIDVEATACFLMTFELIIVQYGHVWNQNDGSEFFNRMMQFDFKKCIALMF